MNSKAHGKTNALIAKSATWYTISNVLFRAVSLITAPIFTRMLSTADYGIVSNFNTWVSIIACFTGLGLSYAVVRGKIEFGEEYSRFLSSIQTLGLISAGVFTVLAVLFSHQLGKFMELDRELVVFMFVYLIFYPSTGFAQTNYRFEYKYKQNILISVMNTFANVFISIALILVFSDQKYVGRIIGTVLPMLLMGICFCARFLSKGKCYVNKTYWKYALSISLPMIPHGLAMIVLAQIDRVMIIKLCGESEAGIYSFGYSYAVLICLLTNALNDAIQPTIFQKMKADDFDGIDSLTHKVCTGIIFASVAIAMGGPEALKLLGTSEYYDARWVICPVIFGSVFQLMYQNYSLTEIYYKKTGIIAVGSVTAAIVNILLNYIFIKRFGYLAAGWTTLVGYIFLMLFHFFGARIASGKKIFRTKSLLTESVLCTVMMTASVVLYFSHWWIRYVALLIVGVIFVWKYRNIAWEYLKRMGSCDAERNIP